MSIDAFRMNRRRLLGLGVASGAAAGLGLTATGCTPDGKSGGAKSAKGLGPEGITMTPGAATAGVQYPDNYVGPRATLKKPFAPAGAPTFKVVVPNDVSTVGDWNKNKFSAWLKQRTGLDVEYLTVAIDGGDMTKINAMIGSGDLPDAFLSIPFTADQVSLYGSQGVFVALDDYLARTIELKRAMSDYPDLATLSKSADGHTYVFPALNDCRQCRAIPGRAWVNRKFLDAVGLDSPSTTAEFRTLLQAFKSKNPNGKGDAIPFVAGASSPIDVFFMNAFLYNPGKPWLRLDNGKVDFVAATDEWREGLRYLRSLNSDGTLTQDTFTMTDQALQKLGDNPGHALIGVARSHFWGSFMTVDPKPDARWRDYAPISALAGPSQVRNFAWNYYQPYSSGVLSQLVITKNCSQPELLVMWADYQLELEAIMRSAWGEKGRDWTWSPKGAKDLAGTQATWKQFVGGSEASVRAGTGWNQHGILYRSSGFRLGEEADPKNPPFAALLDEATVKAYQPYASKKDWQLPPLIFDQTAAARNADILTSVTNEVQNALAEFALGKRNIDSDSDWASYTGALKKMGVSELVGNYQKAYEGRPR
jgi:putative aldouronate transport system substrate-binding protein